MVCCRPPAGPPRCARGSVGEIAATRCSSVRCRPTSSVERCAGARMRPSAGAGQQRALSGGCRARATTGLDAGIVHVCAGSTRPVRPCAPAPCRAPPARPADGGPGAAGWAPAAAPPAARPRHATAARPACPGRPSWRPPRPRWCRRTARAPDTGRGSARLLRCASSCSARSSCLSLAPGRARVRVEDARHLHGQRRAAGDDRPAPQQLPAGAHDRHGLMPGWRQNQRSS